MSDVDNLCKREDNKYFNNTVKEAAFERSETCGNDAKEVTLEIEEISIRKME